MFVGVAGRIALQHDLETVAERDAVVVDGDRADREKRVALGVETGGFRVDDDPAAERDRGAAALLRGRRAGAATIEGEAHPG